MGFLTACVFALICSASIAQTDPQTRDNKAQNTKTQNTMAQRMQACTTCHGAGAGAQVGRTANEAYFPRIAGKPAGYLYNQLLNFRDGRRHFGLMVGMVAHLSDAYLMEMAQYFAQLDLPYPPAMPPKPGATAVTLARGQALVQQGDAARGIPACTACHGASLMGVQPAIPALLGLPRDYMAGQIGAWQTGLRLAHAPDCMGRIAKLLTAQDVDALSTWLAAQPVPLATKPAAALPGVEPAAALLGAKPAAALPAPLPERCGGMP